MATRNIVPNANNEGSLGTDTKRWASGHFQDLKKAGQPVVTDSELSAFSPQWSAISGKPSSFPPSTHNHQISDVTGLQEALNNAGSEGQGGSAAVSVTVGRTGSGADFECVGTLSSPSDHGVIQDAINSIASTGGTVLIREGTYFLSATITISTPNIAIEGAGRASELRCVGDYGNVFLCALPQVPTQWPGMSGLQFSNLRFESTVERTNGAAIRAEYTHNAIFRDLYICDSTYGVSYFQPGTYPQAGKAFYDGIHLNAQNQCHISKVTACCINRCIHINGSGYANADFSYDGYIDNCNFWGSPGARRGVGIYLAANVGGFVVDFCSLNQFEYAIYANAAGTSQGGGIFTIRGGYAENDEHGYWISGYQNTVVEQLWGNLTVTGGKTLVTGAVLGSITINNGTGLIYGDVPVSGTGTWKVINGASSDASNYLVESEDFAAVAGKRYLVETVNGTVTATLPSNPSPGDVVEFIDAKGSWETYNLIVDPSSKAIEGATGLFTVSLTGAFFSLVYVDSTTGWRVLVSAGLKPLNISAPVISGSSAFAATSGSWTGYPSGYSYQWQMSEDGSTGWTDIVGENASSYTADPADEGKYVRVVVTATNANGSSNSASVGAVISAGSSNPGEFPASNLLAFWKLDDATDSSGNGNTLTNNNSTTFTPGKIGNAATFAGSNVSLTRDIVNSFRSGAWSFSIWFTRSSLGGAQTVATVGNFGTGLDFYAGPAHGDGLQLYAKGSYEVLSAMVPANTFVHVALTWTGATGSVYFNGQNAGTLTQNPLSTAGNTLRLGGTACKVDAVGIWTRALASQEVGALYNSGNGLEPV